MGIYVSNPVVNLQDKFMLSFNVSFSKKNEMIIVGADSTKKSKANVSNYSTFLTQINKCLAVDNGNNLIKNSTKYTTDGTYIWRRDNKNTDLLDLELKIVQGKVFEEVKDISMYDPERDTSIYVEGRKLYRYVPDRYVIQNNVVKMKYSTIDFTTIFAYEAGKVKKEEYHIQDNLRTFNNKLRFVLTNGASTFALAKHDGECFQPIQSFFFSSQLQKGYVYYYNDVAIPSNLSIVYST